MFDFFGIVYNSSVYLQMNSNSKIFHQQSFKQLYCIPFKDRLLRSLKGLFQKVHSGGRLKKWLEFTNLYKRRIFIWFETVQIYLHLSCPSEPNDSNIHTDTLYIFLSSSQKNTVSSIPPHTVSIFHLAAVKHYSKLLAFMVMH